MTRPDIAAPPTNEELQDMTATPLPGEPSQPRAPKPPAATSEANPYEPDQQKRCNATRVDGDAFDLCNRTDNHHGDHMRLSYSGVVIKSWDNAQCQHEGPCDAHPVDSAILQPLAYVDRKVPPQPSAPEPPREIWMWEPSLDDDTGEGGGACDTEASARNLADEYGGSVAGPYVLARPTASDEERLCALTNSVSMRDLNSRQSWDVLLPFIATARAEAEAKGRAAGLEEAATFVRLELSEDLGEDLEQGIRALTKGGGK